MNEPILLTTNFDQMDWPQLQAEYIRALEEAHSGALTALRPVACAMAARGATRKYLTALAMARGYKKAYVSSLLSQILVSNGQRQRRAGAGPRIHPLARRFLALAREEAGRSAWKHLASATRLARAEDEEQLVKRIATMLLSAGILLPVSPEPEPALNLIKIKPPPLFQFPPNLTAKPSLDQFTRNP